MRKLKLTQTRQRRFLEALSATGIVSTAAASAGTSRTRVYELRRVANASLTELFTFCFAMEKSP